MSISSENTIRIYVMGSAYEVPRGLTIMSAMEHAGWRFTRGAGCRSGFCGACSTVYRKEGDYRLRFVLACQTEAEDGMYLVQLPFTPAPRVSYTLAELNPDENVLLVEGRYRPGCKPLLRLHSVWTLQHALSGGYQALSYGANGAADLWAIYVSHNRAS